MVVSPPRHICLMFIQLKIQIRLIFLFKYYGFIAGLLNSILSVDLTLQILEICLANDRADATLSGHFTVHAELCKWRL